GRDIRGYVYIIQEPTKKAPLVAFECPEFARHLRQLLIYTSSTNNASLKISNGLIQYGRNMIFGNSSLDRYN
ncbi:hypothetical protein CSKR_203846, partial [Clonorchis sinensis]